MGVHHRHQSLAQRIEIGKWLPRDGRFERLPHPFAGVDFGTIRRLKHQAHIRGKNQALRRVAPGVIHQQDVQTIGIRPAQIVQKVLDHRRVERREFHKVARTRQWFDRPKHPGVLEAVLVDPNRLDAAPGNSPPVDGMQAKAAFIARPNPHGTLRIWRNHGLQLIRKRCLKGRYGVRVFLGLVGRGTLGFAPSL